MISFFLPQRRTEHEVAPYDPLDPFWYGPVGRAVASGVEVNDQVAMTYSAVWAATRLLCGTGGWLPLNLYRRLPNGGRELADDDPRNILVHDRPNPEMPAMMFRSQAIAQQVNNGNCYAEIQRDLRQRPIAYWPIHYTRVQVRRDAETNEIIYRVRNNDGTEILIPRPDMLHVPSMMSDDGIVGKGVIQHARESIGFGIALERHGANWFGKGGIPRIIIKHPSRLDPEARAEFRKEWSEIYGGPDSSKVALLPGGAEAMPITISNEDSQFLASRQHAVEEIARWWGVPPHMIQHLMRATFNNIEHLGIDFVTYSLIPWLKLWEQELWAKTLSEQEQSQYFYEFTVTALLRGDSKSRSEFYATMVNNGIMSRNECRKLENLNPVEGGDEFLVQGAMIPAEDAGKQQEQSLPTDGLDEDDDEDDAETKRREETVRRSAYEILEGTLARMVRKETAAARRAAAKPDKFLQWIDEFYAKHETTIAESVVYPVRAWKALGVDISVNEIAAGMCAQSRDALLTVAGDSTPDKLVENVEALCVTWERERAAEFTMEATAA